MSKQKDGSRAHVPDDGIEMFQVMRVYNSKKQRKGSIIPLSDIWRPIELIPKFGKRCPMNWTFNTSVELSEKFYVNCFGTRQTYQAVY